MKIAWQEVIEMVKKTGAKVKAHTKRRPKKVVQKKVTLTKANAQAYKKKYPITFFKLAKMVGDPKKKTLISRLPDYNAWLQHHDYDNEAWFRGRNKSKKDW